MDFFLFKKREPLYINFDTMLYACKNPDKCIVINVLEMHEQDCLIIGTIDAHNEEHLLNNMIQSISTPDKKIIIYGKNCNDENLTRKIQQLQGLGIDDLYVYRGGMFEWLLLQDIYGEAAFPTTKKVIDILKFKPTTFNV